ncbi:MAG: hypothetical protein Alis3KO_05170 [Aliiglaciecola sp.]
MKTQPSGKMWKMVAKSRHLKFGCGDLSWIDKTKSLIDTIPFIACTKNNQKALLIYRKRR